MSNFAIGREYYNHRMERNYTGKGCAFLSVLDLDFNTTYYTLGRARALDHLACDMRIGCKYKFSPLVYIHMTMKTKQ